VTPAGAPVIDPRVFRDTLGRFASGVVVVTGIDAETPLGFTCQSFYSVSTDPPLISISVLKTSTTYPRIQRTGKFAVNVLGGGQHAISHQFSLSGTDEWAGVGWSTTRAGTPVLEGTMMWVDCTIWAEHDAGDHVIVLGRVQELSPLDAMQHDDPLLYFRGKYRHLDPMGHDHDAAGPTLAARSA
jgi:3-hydroxy-9,10-secoandrosta-1,3,5(10)-triene-9,17-dione monooxygenase reductase component